MLHRSAALVLTLTTVSIAASIAAVPPASAQRESLFQNQEERDIFGNGTDGGNGSALDATNPMDLINRLRQSASMDDATPPSDAIDAALKAFQQKSR